jgi:ketosteroid isomerase-like protein
VRFWATALNPLVRTCWAAFNFVNGEAVRRTTSGKRKYTFRTMTGEKIAVVQRACEAWGTGDLAVLYELYTPDVTADGGKLWLETDQVIEGVDAVVNGFAELIGSFERNELWPEGAIEAGNTLVVPLRWRGLAQGSESFFEQRLIGAFTFRGGRIASMTWFPVLADALDAVGLPSSAAEDLIALERPPLAEEAP